MMNVRKAKTALLWLLLLTSTASYAQTDGHFSDKDQDSPTTEGSTGYNDNGQENPTTEEGIGGHADGDEENPGTETGATKGDANGDGSITMADANMVVNYFLASDKSMVTGIDTDAADVNGDGFITMADANQIVNMFLSGGSKE